MELREQGRSPPNQFSFHFRLSFAKSDHKIVIFSHLKTITYDSTVNRIHGIINEPLTQSSRLIDSCETASVVHTCVFYQACKVHDMSVFGD